MRTLLSATTACLLTLSAAAVVRAQDTTELTLEERTAARTRRPATEEVRPAAPTSEELVAEQGELVRDWERQLAVVSSRNRSRLVSLQRWVELQYDVFGQSPEEDPRYDDFRSFLKGAYEDLYRDHAETLYPIEEAIERAMDRRFGASHRGGGGTARAPGWMPRVSPQAGVRTQGSYVGTKLTWAGDRPSWRDHLSLSLRQTVEGETALRLKFDDGPRFLELGALTGDPDTGRRVWLTARWMF